MLSFVPTPIGNLQDITIRGLERLKSAEYVLCEDTRIARKLFSLLNIDTKNKRFISLHHHNSKKVLENIDISIFETEVVYVSDAGTPGISDPGLELVNFAKNRNIEYEILPGASAFVTAAVASGFSDKELLFAGFLPNKGKFRKEKLESLLYSKYVVILYEAPHRMEKLLGEIDSIASNIELFAIKEITKKFEKRYWGTASEILNRIENFKGEWVVVFKGLDSPSAQITSQEVLSWNIPIKEKAKILAKIENRKVKDIYKELVEER